LTYPNRPSSSAAIVNGSNGRYKTLSREDSAERYINNRSKEAVLLMLECNLLEFVFENAVFVLH